MQLMLLQEEYIEIVQSLAEICWRCINKLTALAFVPHSDEILWVYASHRRQNFSPRNVPLDISKFLTIGDWLSFHTKTTIYERMPVKNYLNFILYLFTS